MDADLDTLATALYVKIDDLLVGSPQHTPWRPRIGLKPRAEAKSFQEVSTRVIGRSVLAA